MNNKKTIFGIIAFTIVILVYLSTNFYQQQYTQSPYSKEPFLINNFQTAEDCSTCHPQHYLEWSSSMHAYAFKDPLFFCNEFKRTRLS